MDSIDRFNLIHSEQIFRINWKDYSEPDIQDLLDIYYTSLGYDVINWHERDRANENAADLTAKYGKKDIAIAVKLSPSKGDREQVSDLADRLEKRKIYYYVNQPTKAFDEKMKKQENVEFKNMDSFIQDCYKNNISLFFDIMLCNNTTLSKDLNQAKYVILKMFSLKTKKANKTFALSNESLRILWRIKDISVQLHKCSEQLMIFYDNRGEPTHEDVKRFLIQLKCFELIMQNLPGFLNQFLEKNKGFISQNVKNTCEDSDWLYLVERPADLKPENISKYLKLTKSNLEKYKRAVVKKDIDIVDELNRVSKNNRKEAMVSILRYFYLFGKFLEQRTDAFFSQSIGGRYERANRDFTEFE